MSEYVPFEQMSVEQIGLRAREIARREIERLQRKMRDYRKWVVHIENANDPKVAQLYAELVAMDVARALVMPRPTDEQYAEIRERARASIDMRNAFDIARSLDQYLGRIPEGLSFLQKVEFVRKLAKEDMEAKCA